jgi:hypothetical protein
MHHRTREQLRRVINWLDWTAAQQNSKNASAVARWLENLFKELEHKMSQYADKIGQLEAGWAADRATIIHLRGQLADALKNATDSADQTAVSGVPDFIAGLPADPGDGTIPPADTTSASAGTDTTVAGTGADTVAGAAR